VKTSLALKVATDWFGYEIVEYDEEALKFVIRLYGNFECASYVSKKDRCMSHLMRGILAGIFGEAYGREFEVIEPKCVAKRR